MNENKQAPNKFLNPGRVKVVQGSILTPENTGLRLVLNVANMRGKAEGPMYPLFDKKWRQVKTEVKGWYNTRTGAYKLGAIHQVSVQSDVWLVSMLCQNEELQTDLSGLKTCLTAVRKLAQYEHATVHLSTLLTETIPELTDLLQSELVDQGVSVSFYKEP